MNKERQYGIWFTDGSMSFGWLQEERGNGYMRPIEGSKEYVEGIRSFNATHDPDYEYVLLALDADDKEAERITEEARERMRARQRTRWQ